MARQKDRRRKKRSGKKQGINNEKMRETEGGHRKYR